MTLDKIEHVYDPDFDILYITIDEPSSAEADPVLDGVYLRREVPSERIVGAIIERYSERDKKMLSQLIPFPLEFQ